VKRDRTIEIQGDHRDTIAEVLLERGFRSKRSGG
jgi:translation initiation factor 1 (eIF-1/SUI1)